MSLLQEFSISCVKVYDGRYKITVNYERGTDKHTVILYSNDYVMCSSIKKIADIVNTDLSDHLYIVI